MSEPYDLIIVGGGHNGLTTAAYVARAGKKVLVCERRHIVGGASVTEDICPGYRCSTLSYVASLLHPKIISDLDLERHGLSFVPMTNVFSPRPDGSYLLMTDDEGHNRREIEKFSRKDWDGRQRLESIIEDIADVLRPLLLRPPIPLSHGRPGLSDILTAGKAGLAFRRLDPETRQRMLQLFTGSVRDVVSRYIESEAVQLSYYGTAVTGALSDIDRPGSALNLLHLSLGQLQGCNGAWAVVRGGMGRISDAIASVATGAGATIRTNAEVKRIVVENGRAIGVELAGTEVIRARAVASNCEPKRTFLNLLDAGDVPQALRADIKQWKTLSASLRATFALSELPDFTCLPGKERGPHHEGFISLKPSVEALDKAYLSARAGLLPREPLMSIVIPSTLDDSLAPEGRHVMCVHAQHYPFDLSDGRNWDDLREEARDTIIGTIAKYAPNFPGSIVGTKLLTPLDLEREYGLTGGDVYHGRMEMDQLFAMRPHPSCAGYSTPISGLYLCGAGTHPGGGVSGMPGHNAARKILSDL